MPIQELSQDETCDREERKRSLLAKRFDRQTMSRSAEQIASSRAPIDLKRSSSWSMSARYQEAYDTDFDVETRPQMSKNVSRSHRASQLECRLMGQSAY